ncbi:MAG TPA: PAS domain S-box protein [Candidatus Baltobacteraceae bacterium]|nr:PAS domain S-box protein [Candidatus Baltobacteraceae bacterium]
MLAFAIDQANDGIAIMQLTGDTDVPIRIVYANDTIERLSGYSYEELLDPSNPFLRVQPQNRALYESLFLEVRAGKSVRFEVELGGKDRSTWTEIRWSPLRYGGGDVTHYVAVLRDITERRRAQAERELLYRAIEEASDYVVLCDAGLPSQGGPRVTYANGAFRHALGYEPDEIVGMSYEQFIAPDNDPRLVANVAELIESSRTIEKEIRLVRSDGSIFWVEVSAHPILAEGMKEHWFVIARDISARKRAIQEVALVTRAIDALPIPIELYGVDGTDAVSIFRNQAAEDTAANASAAHLRRAIASIATGHAEGGASVVPLCDAEGIVDAIMAFALPQKP